MIVHGDLLLKIRQSCWRDSSQIHGRSSSRYWYPPPRSPSYCARAITPLKYRVGFFG